MNRISTARRAAVVKALVDGCSIRATVRMTGASKNTIVKLLVELGDACAKYQDEHIHGVRSARVQCDEIWSFVGAKEKHATEEQKEKGFGDCWTWTAMDADSKLMITYMVGPRRPHFAYELMKDLAARVVGRPQLTTDGFYPYADAVDHAFGSDVDYGQIVKHYGAANDGPSRYSPARLRAATKEVITGEPDPHHISTSYIERSNLTLRMSMRRFTRLTNGFSKKVENHAAMVSLFFMYYNFARIHQSIRVTPAMESGLADHVWSVEEIIGLLSN